MLVVADRRNLLLCMSGSAMSQAAELIVLASQGNAPGVNELAAGFARASGHKVTVLNEAGSALEQRLANGPADLIMGGPEVLNALAKKGRVVAGTVTPYMLAGLGVSVRAGAPKPDISTVEAYTKTLLAAKSIGYSSGCSGEHAAEGIAQLGLTEQLKPKLTVTAWRQGPGDVLSWRAATSSSASSRPTSWSACPAPILSGRCPLASTSRARTASRC